MSVRDRVHDRPGALLVTYDRLVGFLVLVEIFFGGGQVFRFQFDPTTKFYSVGSGTAHGVDGDGSIADFCVAIVILLALNEFGLDAVTHRVSGTQTQVQGLWSCH